MICGIVFYFFFNDTATTEIYTYGHTLSLHDALPISDCDDPADGESCGGRPDLPVAQGCARDDDAADDRCAEGDSSEHLSGRDPGTERSEEHTSELQSLMRTSYAVFCLKKKNTNTTSA